MTLTLPDLEQSPSGAIFDHKRRYRYILWRHWDAALPAVTFIMLNPSAADENFNDPTITRSISLAQSAGFGTVYVVNLFAYMTHSPALLKASREPVTCREDLKNGHHNDDYISLVTAHSEQIVLAWGNHGVHKNRHRTVLDLLRKGGGREKCFVFSITKEGQPRHPLYTPASISLQPAPRDLWI